MTHFIPHCYQVCSLDGDGYVLGYAWAENFDDARKQAESAEPFDGFPDDEERDLIYAKRCEGLDWKQDDFGFTGRGFVDACDAKHIATLVELGFAREVIADGRNNGTDMAHEFYRERCAWECPHNGGRAKK